MQCNRTIRKRNSFDNLQICINIEDRHRQKHICADTARKYKLEIHRYTQTQLTVKLNQVLTRRRKRRNFLRIKLAKIE